MKRAILMSIRKEYTDLIRAGRKNCEYRTNLPAELRVKTMKILLYETKATGGASASKAVFNSGPAALSTKKPGRKIKKQKVFAPICTQMHTNATFCP